MVSGESTTALLKTLLKGRLEKKKRIVRRYLRDHVLTGLDLKIPLPL